MKAKKEWRGKKHGGLRPSFNGDSTRSPTTVAHQHQNNNVKHDICTRTVI